MPYTTANASSPSVLLAPNIAKMTIPAIAVIVMITLYISLSTEHDEVHYSRMELTIQRDKAFCIHERYYSAE